RWAKPRLESLVAQEPDTAEERRQQLHARLALVSGDASHIQPLLKALLAAETSVSHVGVIRDALEARAAEFSEQLWSVLHDTQESKSYRFRAGLALAKYDPHEERWTDNDWRTLAEQLAIANPEHQRALRDLLRPVRADLIEPLETLFADEESSDAQAGAANALADYARDDIPRLARLVSEATPRQYRILYPLVAAPHDQQVTAALASLAAERPQSQDVSDILQIGLAKRRAGAAITLLRRGAREQIFEVLRVEHDINALTQFVHLCREREVRPEQPIECLDATDEQRKSQTTGRAGNDVMFALLLALGEFTLDELPADSRDSLIKRLVDWYANDPSSAVHGASGWLVRHWGQEDRTREVDQTPVPYERNREWFTLEIKVAGSLREPSAAGAGSEPAARQGPRSLFFTFVVVPAGEYTIPVMSTGNARFLLTPDGVAVSVPADGPRLVSVSRPFAILDREITFAELEAFGLEGFRNDQWREPVLNRAALGVSWYDAVHFSRWLTEQHGLAEDDQAYSSVESLAIEGAVVDDQGNVPDWPVDLDRIGFRLPTMGERQIAARAGLHRYSPFGLDKSLADRYGFNDDAIATHGARPPRGFRPNLFGLFDIEGNVYEWCHDRLPERPAETSGEDDNARDKLSRMFMNSSHGNGWRDPAERHNRMGFRVAMTLPETDVPSNGGHAKPE
ncbi:MAG: SUMF1/EgtB/PvdO family nonheme iron enzyme, partial [Pirellulaceae bacterium]|nr:SUMF1/EgtB/PvdO family nonheme iron enzyme [Pirellulaceae bacterium]